MSRFWLVVGTVQNWQTAFDHGNIWGLKETQRALWDRMSENDFVLFYATAPVSGLIGYGTIRTKFKQNRPLWPQEVRENKIIWPLRFEFDVEKCLPYERWQDTRIVSETLKLRVRGGFQPIEDDVGQQLLTVFSLISTAKPPEIPRPQEPEEPSVTPSHDALKKKILEAGRLQQFLAEEEYPFDIGKLDVVWRRVQLSVPTYVFEIQVGGDLYHALTKLKHAYDLWNSRIFLIGQEADQEKVFQLLSGSFHEIQDQLRFVEWQRVEELHSLKKKYRDLEKELGIG